jgi:cytosolic carboxypeptidase protein 6
MNLSSNKFLFIFLISAFIALNGCKSTEDFTGYSYDPEGVTDTADREISAQHKRTIGFLSDGVWISNEFPGSRANDVYRIDTHHYKITINPEISPINNSPWYGFRIWADDSVSVKIELEYNNGRQRYFPKLSTDEGINWVKADSSDYHIDPETRNGFINLDLSSEVLWVSAQEVYTTHQFKLWTDKFLLKPFVQRSVIGSSHQGRPIKMLKISEQSKEPVKGVIVIYGRQHPPEIPGYMVSIGFLETLAGDTPLAKQFREYFDVWAFPMMNPDGADNGHWRTNAAGVDLNRDWQFFNQPETRAVRDALLPLITRNDRKVFYGIDFHSTGRNIFYPILREIDTFPLHFTYVWAEKIQADLPEINLGVQAFDIVSPISKNWTHKTFGVDAVTFEVWDHQSRDELNNFATRSAEIFMEMMIEEFEKELKSEERVLR